MPQEPQLVEKKTRLLVVDDEEIILNIATDVLESEGYDVETQSNPVKALERLKETEFDFILTDINMPEMNGLELVKNALELDSDLGAIFMTGYANLETAKEAIKTGAFDYVMKPFELSELRAAVTKAVEKRMQQVAKSESSRLEKLSDLVEVLYTVGDKTSLLKLSLGLALINSGVSTGAIACWEKKTSEMAIIWTDNVRQSDFHEIVFEAETDLAIKGFDFDSNLHTVGIESHPLYRSTVKAKPEIRTLRKYFNDDSGTTTLRAFHGDQFYMAILVADSGEEDSLSDSDIKLLNIVLNMAMVVVENVLLLSESQQALKELESLHDQMVNLERVATQGIMSAEIGHELNNYLNIVRSNFELLRFKAEITNIDEMSKYMRGIEESIDQMTKFTRGLTDAATLKSEKKDIDLNSLIDDIISFLSPQKKFREINLEHVRTSDIPMINADCRQLEQLFYNTLNNAAEALHESNPPEKRIVIETEGTDTELKFRIIDNGCGIPQELLDNTFSNRFTTKSGGHGFGLIVCKKVVENHNGTIVVESEEGKGTTFHITLPAQA